MNEFYEQLWRHLRFIENSCTEFDKGQVDESLRIAVSIRVLFHDTKSSTSIVSHLKMKESIKLVSTFISTESMHFLANNSFQSHTILPLMLTSNGVKVPLESWKTRATLSIEDWWNEIIWKENGEKYSRRDVVLSAANQDGGAHVDSKPDHKTLKFREGPKVEVKVNGVAIPNPATNHHFNLLRQIAHELLNSSELTSIAKKA